MNLDTNRLFYLAQKAFRACVSSADSLVNEEAIPAMWDKINTHGKTMWVRVVQTIAAELHYQQMKPHALPLSFDVEQVAVMLDGWRDHLLYKQRLGGHINPAMSPLAMAQEIAKVFGANPGCSADQIAAHDAETGEVMRRDLLKIISEDLADGWPTKLYAQGIPAPVDYVATQMGPIEPSPARRHLYRMD